MSEAETPAVVEAAIARLRDEGLIGSGATSLSLVEESDLVRSTVRLLEISDGESSVRVYHKRIKPRTESRKAETLLAEERDSLSMAEGLEASLAHALPAPQIQVGRTIAADVESLEQVTLSVPGAHLGALWRRGLTPSRRERTLAAVRLVGSACRVIEEVGRYQGAMHPRLVGNTVVERRVSRLEGSFGAADRDRLRGIMVELEGEAMDRDNALYRSHGDLNATNVLLHSEGISLIDFAWHPGLRLTDLAHFAYRLEYESGSPRSLADQMTVALLGGYGEDVRSDPAWRFLRYSKLIRVVSGFSSSRNPMARLRASRARAELARVIADQ